MKSETEPRFVATLDIPYKILLMKLMSSWLPQSFGGFQSIAKLKDLGFFLCVLPPHVVSAHGEF